MTVKPFSPVFIALVGTVVYAYYYAEQRPEKATTLTPKEYIEMVEEKKSERDKATDQRREQSSDAANN
ncbi:MAG: hypothetical protein MI754_02395 [Chromatiales bacterium]|nr:hypothetical protein [Chromatiales bacterium]